MRLKRRPAARRLLVLLLAVCGLVVIAACSAPPLNTLALRPEADHHTMMRDQVLTVTFTNRSGGAVTVAGIEWDPRNQESFQLVENGCRRTISPNRECTVRIRKIVTISVDIYLYLGDSNRKPLGGVIIN